MGTETSLVLVFKDEDGADSTMIIRNPADDLSLETVQGVMAKIIECDAILTNAGKHLDAIGNCFYRTVTNTPLESDDGE